MRLSLCVIIADIDYLFEVQKRFEVARRCNLEIKADYIK